MDPATAAMNMISRFLEFLCTPVGQKVAEDWHQTLLKWRDEADRLIAGARPPQIEAPKP